MSVVWSSRLTPALVDPEVWPLCMLYQWHDSAIGRGGHRYFVAREGGRTIYLHRLVTEAPKGIRVDHINMNTFDCRKANLRFGTASDNGCNRGAQVNSSTGLKGVYKSANGQRFTAKVAKDRKQFHLGTFDTPEEAHAAYVSAAASHHGEFARTA